MILKNALQFLLPGLSGLVAAGALLVLASGCRTVPEEDARPAKLSAWEEALELSHVHEHFARERLHRTNNEIKRLTSLRDTTLTNYLSGASLDAPNPKYPGQFDTAVEYLGELKKSRAELRETILDSNKLQLSLNKEVKQLQQDIKNIPYIYSLYIDKNEYDVDVPPLPNVDLGKLIPPPPDDGKPKLNVNIPD